MLNVSIVLYNMDWQEVQTLLETLLQSPQLRHIYLIDNSPMPSEEALQLIQKQHQKPLYEQKVVYKHNQGRNLGYGAGHNIALRESIYDNIPYHLVMNSDIELQVGDLEKMVEFMDRYPLAGMVSPRMVYKNGEPQDTATLLPTPMDLFARRFLMYSHLSIIRKIFEWKNRKYTLRNIDHSRLLNVPKLSGCFMFLRVSALEKVGLFDERFSLYMEDVDLSRRMHRHYLTIYYPFVTIIHAYRRASHQKGRAMRLHIQNAIRYFNKYGWLFDKERRMMNKIAKENLQ